MPQPDLFSGLDRLPCMGPTSTVLGEANGEVGLALERMAAVYEAQTLKTSCWTPWHRCSASISACRRACRACTHALCQRLSQALEPAAGESRFHRSCRAFCSIAWRDCAWCVARRQRWNPDSAAKAHPQSRKVLRFPSFVLLLSSCGLRWSERYMAFPFKYDRCGCSLLGMTP